MRVLIALGILWAVTAAFGVGASREPGRVAAVPPPMRLIGHRGLAHACPASATTAWTSRHVAMDERDPAIARRLAFVWSLQSSTGSAWALDFDLRRDLAVVALDPPVAVLPSVSDDPPAVGERVYAWAYGASLEPKLVRATVERVVGAHLVLSEPGSPGMSGGCVWTERGQVVGVWQWGVELVNGKARGIASAVWGPWGDVSWLPPAGGHHALDGEAGDPASAQPGLRGLGGI